MDFAKYIAQLTLAPFGSRTVRKPFPSEADVLNWKTHLCTVRPIPKGVDFRRQSTGYGWSYQLTKKGELLGTKWPATYDRDYYDGFDFYYKGPRPSAEELEAELAPEGRTPLLANRVSIAGDKLVVKTYNYKTKERSEQSLPLPTSDAKLDELLATLTF